MSAEKLTESMVVTPLFDDADLIRRESKIHTLNWSFNPDNFDLKVWLADFGEQRVHHIVDPDGFYHGMTGVTLFDHHTLVRSNAAKLDSKYLNAIERKLKFFLGI